VKLDVFNRNFLSSAKDLHFFVFSFVQMAIPCSVSTNDATPPPIKVTTGHLQQVQRKVQDSHNNHDKAHNIPLVATTEHSLKLKR